jgi:hypothetical protein
VRTALRLQSGSCATEPPPLDFRGGVGTLTGERNTYLNLQKTPRISTKNTPPLPHRRLLACFPSRCPNCTPNGCKIDIGPRTGSHCCSFATPPLNVPVVFLAGRQADTMRKQDGAGVEGEQSSRSKLDTLAASLRRAYVRQLTATGARQRPSVLEGLVLDQASYLRARAIQLARDTSISADQLTRITSSAAVADSNVAELVLQRKERLERQRASEPVVAAPVPARVEVDAMVAAAQARLSSS